MPALELPDSRVLSETRAICSYLEGLHPEPNLMGEGFDERAFIEMHDRRVEWYWLLPIANCVRHTHPGLAALEQPQFPDFGRSQGQKVRESARWLDEALRQLAMTSPAAETCLSTADGELRLDIRGEPGVTYHTEFVATLRGARLDSTPRADAGCSSPTTLR